MQYFCNSGFVYIQVNETQKYVQDSLNTTTVVVLEVLFL